MKVRVKFSKTGPMKFIGHLDMMRYFQKAIRRAGFDIAFSEGYSPHMILSFASPLGVGVESLGEYFDMELNTVGSAESMIARFNEVMAEGVEILSMVRVPEGKAGKAMSLVSAADYKVSFREGCAPGDDWAQRFAAYLGQAQILITKKTKKSEQETDIRPLIQTWRMEDEHIFFRLASGSAMNLKPELVMEGFFHFLQQPFNPLAIQVMRLEVYGDTPEGPKPLGDLGENIA